MEKADSTLNKLNLNEPERILNYILQCALALEYMQ